mmetsp:Transcript_9949/g.28278  ORF Transcript_9949/g.28278 Transcript_9949/m.28278 type:complete len:255 (-) Transcript_9949:604-1368(-)
MISAWATDTVNSLASPPKSSSKSTTPRWGFQCKVLGALSALYWEPKVSSIHCTSLGVLTSPSKRGGQKSSDKITVLKSWVIAECPWLCCTRALMFEVILFESAMSLSMISQSLRLLAPNLSFRSSKILVSSSMSSSTLDRSLSASIILYSLMKYSLFPRTSIKAATMSFEAVLKVFLTLAELKSWAAWIGTGSHCSSFRTRSTSSRSSVLCAPPSWNLPSAPSSSSSPPFTKSKFSSYTTMFTVHLVVSFLFFR